MINFNIETPETFDVTSRGKSVSVDMASLTPELMARLAMHGLTQKVADAAAGALAASLPEGSDKWSKADKKDWAADNAETIAETGQALMQKVVDRLLEGDWGAERGTGASGDPMDQYRVAYMRQLMRANPNGKLKPAHDAIDGTAARRAYLLEVAAKNFDKVEPGAIALREAAREAARAAEQVKGLDI